MTIKNADMPAMPIQLNDGEVWSEEIDHANGLTKREMFCLRMGVAETGDAGLDAIIRKGNRQKMAMHMMSGLLSKPGHSFNEHDVANDAVRAADALFSALERTK